MITAILPILNEFLKIQSLMKRFRKPLQALELKHENETKDMRFLFGFCFSL